jgi:pimeloyl-ACP methyl ester carboxylesterase
VVGLNTSAFLEGAIAGRPIFAPLLPEHHENQEGTIHFHYLLHVNGGLLHTARTLGDHVEQLNAVLQTSENESERSRRFVEAFIRPRGVDVAASPVFAGEVENLAAARPARVAHTIGESLGGNIARWLLRAALAPAAALAALDAAAPLMLSEHEREIAARHRAHRDLVAEAWRVKDEHNAEEQEHKNARAAQRQRYKAARAAEWRRTKKMKNLKQRLKKRIGRAS